MSSRELSEWEALHMLELEEQEGPRPTPPARAAALSKARTPRTPLTPEELLRQIDRAFPITAERGRGQR